MAELICVQVFCWIRQLGITLKICYHHQVVFSKDLHEIVGGKIAIALCKNVVGMGC